MKFAYIDQIEAIYSNNKGVWFTSPSKYYKDHGEEGWTLPNRRIRISSVRQLLQLFRRGFRRQMNVRMSYGFLSWFGFSLSSFYFIFVKMLRLIMCLLLSFLLIGSKLVFLRISIWNSKRIRIKAFGEGEGIDFSRVTVSPSPFF